MQSLFVLGLPRTFSTQVYQLASNSLQLRQPSWVMDGEILNVDRYRHYHGLRFDESAKFTTPQREPELVAQLHDFLDQLAVAEGFIYKVVTQPFVMAEWRGLKRFRVLKLRREVADVAYAMLSRGWFAPQNAARQLSRMPRVLALTRKLTPFDYSGKLHALFRSHFADSVVEGLVRAERALEVIPGVTIAYDDVVRNEAVLRDALQELYPQSAPKPLSFIDAAFVRHREAVERRRTTREYQQLQAKVARAQKNSA